ncbi:glycosyltransferase [Gandjariella thermophila]|uniref:Glycosyltransferase 2-like domain-containing protein n=1 Tax=Gandjariella thermophila TaxID=1931992 RepID=A0A4D4JA52_9PSEU|nr:glycosyltransferase [Gandjariella thermophila]GDY33551.1 hypothetical protein GTS_51840 [Gandjariella thermophila]
MVTRPEVSVLIVNWNTREATRRCLDSLPGAVTDGLGYQVIVVDNASRDGSADVLATYRDIVWIRNDTNVGFAAAVNQAYRHATGELILLLNSDICLGPGALTALVRFLRQRPDAAGVAPLYLNPDGTLQQHYMRLPTFRSALALGTVLRFLPGFHRAWRDHVLAGEEFSRPRPVPQPSVSCLLLRRGVLGADRIFDERFPLYFNDVWLARGLAEAGHELWVTPDAAATHTLGASTRLLGAEKRTAYRLEGLVRYVRLTQTTPRLRVFQLVVLLDRLARRVLRLRGHLALAQLWAALRGTLGPLPDLDPRGWVVMFSGVGWLRWSAGEHRQHALARALSARRRVLFVDPCPQRLRWTFDVRQVAGSLWHACVPGVLPAGRALPPANWVNRRVAAVLLRRWLRRRPGARLVWLDEDLSAPCARWLGADAVVYDVADLDWTFARPCNRWHLRRGMATAVRLADRVVTSSPALPRWLPPSRCPPVVVPNGCDPQRFTPDGPLAPAVADLAGPRLGYAGAIDTRAFDADMLAAVARHRPDWTFVLIGPATRAGRAPLAGLGNVHVLGAMHAHDVPAALRACDVCLIPYRVGGLVDYVHPKKLYEYLALGKPVVATRLPALVALDGLVYLADGSTEFATAIEKALAACHDPASAARRRAVACRNSWSNRCEQLLALFATLEGARP